MKSNVNLSGLALRNVEALAYVEEPEIGVGNEFNCSLGKDKCVITVTVNLVPKLKEKFNINVSVGVTVDLTDFTQVYAAAVPNKPRVRCGTDVLCRDLF